ncbi:U-box domain-containing protein 33 [Linum grandiflorum]
MAVMMSPATPITQLMNQPMSLVEFGGSRRMSSSSISSSIGEISPVARVIDEKIYVAVGKTFDKSKSAVVWALQNSGGKKICVLHVHQPAQMIPLLGAKFEASTLKEREVKAYRDIQRGKMHKVLAEYLRLCGRVGVRAEAMVIEKESIEEGILELISKHGIKKLVMGAADNSRYYKNMTNLKSKKAIFVKEQAPAACHIWFVCKSHLIHTRAVVTPPRSDAEESSYVNEPRRSTSHGSVLSSSSSGGMANLAIVPSTLTEGSDVAAEMSTFPEITDNLCHTSPPSVPEITVVDPLYEQLKRTMEESIFSEREALEEATRRAKAEKNTIEAIHRNHKCSLETQIDEADRTATELEQKIFAAVELLQKYNKEREELQVERDDALREAEELRRSRAETSNGSTAEFFSDFRFSEIEEATNNFHPSLKIGEGGFGSIYRGVLHHTEVAIKMLHANSMQGPSEYQQEVFFC